MVAGSFAVRVTVKLLLKVLLLGLAVVTGAVLSVAAGTVVVAVVEEVLDVPASGNHSKLLPQPARSDNAIEITAAFINGFNAISSTGLNVITLTMRTKSLIILNLCKNMQNLSFSMPSPTQ